MKNKFFVLFLTLFTLLLKVQTVAASEYHQEFCRSNDLESLKLKLNLQENEITSTLTYSSKDSKPEVESFKDQLFSEGPLVNDDVAYLADELTRWEYLTSAVVSGFNLIGADDKNDQSTVTRIYYVIKDENNNEFLFVKTTGLYYYGSSAHCKE